MNIKSNHDLYIALNNTMNSPQLAIIFMERFKEISGGLQLSHKEGSFFRCASMYMDGSWNYDHKYYQRMIDRHGRMNAEVVGYIMTDMSELNKDDSSSDGGSTPGLQEGDQSDWSSNDDTDSYGDNDMYDDEEWWGYKEQTLKQIISGTHDGMFLASDTPTLYAFSFHRYAKVLTANILGAFLSVDWSVDAKVKVNSILHNGATDFCQARE